MFISCKCYSKNRVLHTNVGVCIYIMTSNEDYFIWFEEGSVVLSKSGKNCSVFWTLDAVTAPACDNPSSLVSFSSSVELGLSLPLADS